MQDWSCRSGKGKSKGNDNNISMHTHTFKQVQTLCLYDRAQHTDTYWMVSGVVLSFHVHRDTHGLLISPSDTLPGAVQVWSVLSATVIIWFNV